MSKKIKIIPVILLILSITLSMHIYAFETVVIPTNNVIMGLYAGPRSSVPTEDRWLLTSFAPDYNNKQFYISIGTQYETWPFVAGFLTSYIKPDTFYKITFEADITRTDGTSLLTETGIIKATNTEWFNLIRKETFVDVEHNLNGTLKSITTTYQNSLMNDDYYTMFYDQTSNQFSVLFYIPKDYWTSHPEIQQEVYLVTSLGISNLTGVQLRFWIDEYTGLSARDNYTDVLNEISQKLDNIAAAGGGITEEQVKNAISEALEAEKQEASSGAQAGLDELAGALSGVTDDITQAQQAIESLGSALSYSGTSASITFPAMNVPFLGQISEPINFDMTGYIDSTFPPQLLLLIRCAFSIGIVSYPIFELVRQLRKLLDKG